VRAHEEGNRETGDYNNRYFSMSSILKMSALALTVALIGASAVSFAQAATTGSVKVVALVQGGTAKASDFTLTINKKDATRTSRISAKGGTITFNVEPGTYVISKTSGPSRYTSVWGGACNAAGEVVITEATQVNFEHRHNRFCSRYLESRSRTIETSTVV
jgi:hypothetical protein